MHLLFMHSKAHLSRHHLNSAKRTQVISVPCIKELEGPAADKAVSLEG